MNRFKRSLCFLLVTIVLATSGSYAVVAEDAPSSWAVNEVNQAINARLVPTALRTNYTQATTRAEFCALAVSLYESVTGSVITNRQTFSDTNDINVQMMAAIGVVNGVGDNRFNPDGTLTREMAATLLARLANAIGNPLPKQAATFSDSSSISSWATEAVGHMFAAGIMTGTGNNMFSPNVAYTREMSIITVLRTYEYAYGTTSQQSLQQPPTPQSALTPGDLLDSAYAFVAGIWKHNIGTETHYYEFMSNGEYRLYNGSGTRFAAIHKGLYKIEEYAGTSDDSIFHIAS